MTSSENLALISIVTSFYNQSAFLKQTIPSVLWQDYPNIKFIGVDGNCTDGSQKVIKRFADRLV